MKFKLFATLIISALAILAAPAVHADDHEPGIDAAICRELLLGKTPSQIAAELHAGSPQWSESQMLVTVLDQLGYC